MKNQRESIQLIYDGRKQSVKAWALELGIPVTTLYSRIGRGLTAKEAIEGVLMGADGDERTRYIPRPKVNGKRKRKRRTSTSAARVVGAVQALIKLDIRAERFRELVREALINEGYR